VAKFSHNKFAKYVATTHHKSYRLCKGKMLLPLSQNIDMVRLFQSQTFSTLTMNSQKNRESNNIKNILVDLS
jgi:hypothetical protein